MYPQELCDLAAKCDHDVGVDRPVGWEFPLGLIIIALLSFSSGYKVP